MIQEGESEIVAAKTGSMEEEDEGERKAEEGEGVSVADASGERCGACGHDQGKMAEMEEKLAKQAGEMDELRKANEVRAISLQHACFFVCTFHGCNHLSSRCVVMGTHTLVGSVCPSEENVPVYSLEAYIFSPARMHNQPQELVKSCAGLRDEVVSLKTQLEKASAVCASLFSPFHDRLICSQLAHACSFVCSFLVQPLDPHSFPSSCALIPQFLRMSFS